MQFSPKLISTEMHSYTDINPQLCVLNWSRRRNYCVKDLCIRYREVLKGSRIDSNSQMLITIIKLMIMVMGVLIQVGAVLVATIIQ